MGTIERNEIEPKTVVKIPKLVDDDHNTELHFAASKGDNNDIAVLLKNGDKIDAQNFLGWTPLMVAVRRGHLSTVKILLDNGADASKKNKFGFNVFMLSIASKKLTMVQLILEHVLCGGISRKSLQDVISPLSISIMFSENAIFQYLLTKNFNVNEATPNTGLTPLFFAAALNNRELYRILVKHGANEQTTCFQGCVPMDIIRSREKYEEQEKYNKLKKSSNLGNKCKVEQSNLFGPCPYVLMNPIQNAQVSPFSNFNHSFDGANMPSPNMCFSHVYSPVYAMNYSNSAMPVPNFARPSFLSPVMPQHFYTPSPSYFQSPSHFVPTV